MPIGDRTWDNGGHVHGRFSLTGCPRVGYGSPRGWRRPDWVNAYVSVCLLAYYVEWPTVIAR